MDDEGLAFAELAEGELAGAQFWNCESTRAVRPTRDRMDTYRRDIITFSLDPAAWGNLNIYYFISI
jgi:hypothetical protein